MRCTNCNKEINLNIGKPPLSDWLKLMHYFLHELTEDEITENTFESMMDALMTFKPEEY